jgi:GNAT superfamily N-acetyltransferase
MPTIAIAKSAQEIARCFSTMSLLRPHLQEAEFVGRVIRQHQASGFQLAFLEEAGEVKAVAGFRIAEFLGWGRTLYVDDLSTLESERSRGFGGQLFDWLVEHAKAQGCDEFHLDSGVHRHGAHRFYLRKRMDISSHHFSMRLKTPV